MRAIKITAISTIAIGLLAGSAVGVAAQEEEADPRAPAFFTYTAKPPQDGIGGPAPGEMMLSVDATDRRASGMLTIAPDSEFLATDRGTFLVISRSSRLVNEDGAWSGLGRGVHYSGEDGRVVQFQMSWLFGEGDYDGLLMGLSVIQTVDPDPSTALGDLRWGVIVPASMWEDPPPISVPPAE